jgi:hypothetical protein
VTTRLSIAICFLTLTSLPTRASALEDERIWEQKQEEGLRALRLAVPVGAINVAYLAAASGIWLAGAHGGETDAQRRGAYAIGGIAAAGAVANIAWLVYASETLAEYKRRNGNWMSLQRARLHTGFTALDTALRIPGIVGGSMILAGVTSGRLDPINRGSGFVFLIPNLLVLPFHIWALYATAQELRFRKRETTSQARRMQPMPSGFRF